MTRTCSLRAVPEPDAYRLPHRVIPSRYALTIEPEIAGCFGLKPSFGRVPIYPPSALEEISHAGPLTNTVRDAALTMNVIAGPDDRDRNSLSSADLAGPVGTATGLVGGAADVA